MNVSLLVLCIVAARGLCWERRVLSDDFIDAVNIRASWTARRSFHEHSSLKNLLSVLPENEMSLPSGGSEIVKNLPKDFDARIKWKRCKSIKDVYNQGNCASGWAVAVAAVFRDRLCVSNATRAHISAHFLMTCCANCGQGCFGGYANRALRYLQSHGVPIEGKKGCQRYRIRPCSTINNTIRCHRVREMSGWCYEYKCSNGRSIRSQMLAKSRSVYSVHGEERIQSEIFNTGPVLGVMTVYEDFFVYKNGVYEHTEGKNVGSQEVKVIGWGIDQKNKKYWLVVNSWGSIWGESGLMKIARGRNECGLEETVFSLRV